MTQATDAFQKRHQDITMKLLDDFSAAVDKCQSDQEVAKLLGFAQPAEGSAEMEALPARIALRQIQASVTAGTLAPTATELAAMTGTNTATHTLSIDRSAEGVISEYFSRLPKLAGRHFAKPGAIEDVEPSRLSLALFKLEDGSMMVTQTHTSGNSAKISMQIASLASNAADLVKPAEAGAFQQSNAELIAQISEGVESAKGKALLPSMADEFFFEVSLAAFRTQETGITAPMDSFDQLMSKVFDDLADPASGQWKNGVDQVCLDGKSIRSISALREALSAPAPISLDEALARKSAAAHDAQVTGSAPNSVKPPSKRH